MNRTLSSQNLDGFNYEETKRNINNYFVDMEKLQWELAKLNAQNELTADFDYSLEYQRKSYIPVGKDTFNLSEIENKEEKLKKKIAGYKWAKSILSEQEQKYLLEYFINHKYENEIIGLMGFGSTDSREYRRLKRSAIYKFADVLNLVVNK